MKKKQPIDFDSMGTIEILDTFIENDKLGTYVMKNIFDELIKCAPNHVLSDTVGKFISHDPEMLEDWMDKEINNMLISMMGTICREIKNRIEEDLHEFDI